MKSLRSDEVGPGIELSESEYLFDFEVLIEWAALLEETDIPLALKCIFKNVMIRLRTCSSNFAKY